MSIRSSAGVAASAFPGTATTWRSISPSTATGSMNVGITLPLPRDRETVELLVPRIREVRRRVPVPFLLENNVYYFDIPGVRDGRADLPQPALPRKRLRPGARPAQRLHERTQPRLRRRGDARRARARARRRDPRRRRHGARRLLSRRSLRHHSRPGLVAPGMDPAALPERRRRHLRAVRLMVRKRRQCADPRRPAPPSGALGGRAASGAAPCACGVEPA